MKEKDSFYDFPAAKGIVVSGDIHGEFNQFVYKCCVQYSMTDTLIIVAGDCGFGFEQPDYYENVYTIVRACGHNVTSLVLWTLSSKLASCVR